MTESLSLKIYMNPQKTVKLPHGLHKSITRYVKKSGMPMQNAVMKLIKKGVFIND